MNEASEPAAPPSRAPRRALVATTAAIGGVAAAITTTVVGAGVNVRIWWWSDVKDRWAFVHVPLGERVAYHLFLAAFGFVAGVLAVQRRVRDPKEVGAFVARLAGFLALDAAVALAIGVASLFPPEPHETGGGGLGGLVSGVADVAGELLFGIYHGALVAAAGAVAYGAALALAAVCAREANAGKIARAESIAGGALAGALLVSLGSIGVIGLPFFAGLAAIALAAVAAARAAKGRPAALGLAVAGSSIAVGAGVLGMDAWRWERERARRASRPACYATPERPPAVAAYEVESVPATGGPRHIVLAAAGHTPEQAVEAMTASLGTCRDGNAFVPREHPPVVVAATPAPIDLEIEMASALGETAAIAQRAERAAREAFARAGIKGRGYQPLVNLDRVSMPGATVLVMRCADGAGGGSPCDAREMAVEGWEVGRYPVLGKLTVRVTPVDAVGDYDKAGQLGRAAAGGSMAGADAATRLAVARVQVLLGRAYDEAELEAALAGGRDDDAANHRRDALGRFQGAVTITTALLTERSSDAEGALRDPARLDAWLRAHVNDEADAGLLLWAGAAWAGKARLGEGAESAEARAVAEKLLAKARAGGRGVVWELATMELATLFARSAPPRLDAAQTLFEEAIRKAAHGSPLVRVAYAVEVACRKGDGVAHGRLLGEAQAYDDGEVLRRWEIAIGKALARRAGTQERWRRCREGKG